MDSFIDEPQGLISVVGFCIMSSLVGVLDINASLDKGTSGCQGERAHWRLWLAFSRSKLTEKKKNNRKAVQKNASLSIAKIKKKRQNENKSMNRSLKCDEKIIPNIKDREHKINIFIIQNIWVL